MFLPILTVEMCSTNQFKDACRSATNGYEVGRRRRLHEAQTEVLCGTGTASGGGFFMWANIMVEDG